MLVLCGKSGAGKDSILKILTSKYKLSKITTWTTREKRPGEVGGVDYNFCTNEEFDKLKDIGFFAETTSYVMAGDKYVQYGTAIEDLQGDKCLILNPEGLKNLRRLKSLNMIVFYIYTPTETLIERLKNRGDSEEEYKRRLETDFWDFQDIDDYVDYTLYNDDSISLEALAELIYDLFTD